MGEGSYIIEIIRRGNAVRVSAVDPQTGLEAVLVGDPRASEAELRRLAVQKIEYIKNKNLK
jgi:hypothetical protein